MNEFRVGDEGSILRVTVREDGVAVDISSATTKKINLLNPDGIKTPKTADFTTDGSDGKIEYIVIAGDLNRSGIWRIEAHIESPSGKWTTSPEDFQVFKKI